jgi:hypothetical protein
VRNRASGTWVIHLARKIAGPNGEFRGLVSGALELKYFEEFFGDIALAPGGTIEVFRHDTTLLVRHPKAEALIGRRFAAATALKLVATTEHGVGRDVTSGEELLVAAHRVDGYPIVVSVNKTAAATLADWQLTAKYLAGVAALTIVALAGLAYLFIRLFGNYHALMHSRAEQEKSEQLRRASRRFDVALSNMSQGPVHVRRPAAADRLQPALCRAVRSDRGTDPAGDHAARHPGAADSRRNRPAGREKLRQ